MVGRYLYRRLNGDEIDTSAIKVINNNSGKDEDEMRSTIVNHIKQAGKPNVKKKYPVISLTSSLEVVCGGVWHGPFVAIIKREWIEEISLIDVSTRSNFEGLCYFIDPSSMPTERIHWTHQFSEKSKEYCYISNIPKNSYAIVKKEHLEKIKDLSAVSNDLVEWMRQNFGEKLSRLVRIHPGIEQNPRYSEKDYFKLAEFYTKLIKSYLEDNYRDLDDLVTKNGFMIPPGSKKLLQEIVNYCENSEVMKMRRMQDILVDNLFEQEKAGRIYTLI